MKDEIQSATYFHFRAPTSIGIYAILYLGLLSKTKGWFKYAGDWQSNSLPTTYRIQRYLLKIQNKPVTINGSWPNQPQHCKSFKNPCITQSELLTGYKIRSQKVLKVSRIEICFVGRLEPKKGFDIFMECLISLRAELRQEISKIHIVGSGPLQNRYKDRLTNSLLPCIFYGNLSREEVHKVYSNCDALVLPSVTEGFPKVVVEAMNYGCVPVVTNMSSIREVVTSKNGFLIAGHSEEKLKEQIVNMLQLKPERFRSMLKNSERDLSDYTYDSYNVEISNLIGLQDK